MIIKMATNNELFSLLQEFPRKTLRVSASENSTLLSGLQPLPHLGPSILPANRRWMYMHTCTYVHKTDCSYTYRAKAKEDWSSRPF